MICFVFLFYYFGVNYREVITRAYKQMFTEYQFYYKGIEQSISGVIKLDPGGPVSCRV